MEETKEMKVIDGLIDKAKFQLNRLQIEYKANSSLVLRKRRIFLARAALSRLLGIIEEEEASLK